ncbi:MAG TPA: histidine triad nucleotide-binding protein [Acidimicrobiales bacterium]|nr:histidine triad nucleotide-binding protein [Acidimicrobiales bacterium]
MAGDCLFCKIVAGEVPSKEVVSTGATYAFFDINPAAPVHFLVVPRRHITNAASVQRGDGDVLAEMFETARAGAELLGIAEGGYRLVFNVGPHALNSVPHLHMHVVGGQQMGWPPGVDPIG